jgi:RND superfamily putative drug exporter
MLHRYGAFVARHAKITLLLSGLAVLVAALIGVGAFGVLRNGGFDDPAADATRAHQLIDTRFGGTANLVLLVRARHGDIDTPSAHAAGLGLTRRLAAEPGVDHVASYFTTGAAPLRGTDGRQALVLVHVRGGDTEVLTRGRTLIDRYTRPGPAVTVLAGGEAAVNRDVTDAVTRSLAVAEAIAVPVTMILLVLAFGSLVAAALPLVIGTVAVLGTFAELHLLGSATDVSVFAINLTTALGLGLAIDYALLMVSRFREEIAAGHPTGEAVARTVATAGRTVLFSAATIAAALAAMLVFPLYFLRSFGYAGIGVVLISAVAALVVAPALLAVLGQRVNAGAVPWARRRLRGPDSPAWRRVASAAMRRPVLAALPALAVLLLAAAPLAHVRFGTPDSGVLPASAGSRQVDASVRAGFPGAGTAAVDVVLDGVVGRQDLVSYARQLSGLAGVTRVDSAAGGYAAGAAVAPGPAALDASRRDAQRLAVLTGLAPKSAGARALVAEVRAVPAPAGSRAFVGGEDARFVDTQHAIGSRLPLAVGLVVATTFLLLFLFTGSVLQPVRALLMGALSLGATLGLMTLVFQDGHLAGALGVTARPMDTAMTVLLFCLAFGLSMDYEVIVTSRIKELHDSGADPTRATVTGLARSGRIVSTAAALLAVSFVAFGTASVSFLQMFGLASALAILIDATLIRGVLVPVVMRLAGRRIWYAPAPLRRVQARLALAEA